MTISVNQQLGSQDVAAVTARPVSTNTLPASPQVNAASADRTSLSTSGAAVSSLVSQAMQSAPVRQDKVDSLRQQIADGTYSVNPRQIATGIASENQ